MIRVATWNMKQAVAPKRILPELWKWVEERVAPDVVVLTEARVPPAGPPPGWTALWRCGGIDRRRSWGTVLAGRNVEMVEVPSVKIRRRTINLYGHWPGTVVVSDLKIQGHYWATVVGLYAITLDPDGKACGNLHVGAGQVHQPASMFHPPPHRGLDRRMSVGARGAWAVSATFTSGLCWLRSSSRRRSCS